MGLQGVLRDLATEQEEQGAWYIDSVSRFKHMQRFH